MKLQSSVIGVVVLSVVIVVSVSLLLALIPARERMEEEFYQRIPAVLEAAASGTQAELARGWGISLSLSRNPFIIEWALRGEQDAGLEDGVVDTMREIQDREGVMSTFVAPLSTRNFWSNGEIAQELVAGREDDEWFFEMIEAEEELLLNLDYNPELDETALWFNAAMESGEERIGVAGIGLRIDEVIEDFRDAAPSPNSTIYLVDQEGEILVASEDERPGQSVSDYIPEAAAPMQDHPNLRRFVDDTHGEMIVTETSLGDTSYSVVLSAPEREFVPSILDYAGQPIVFVLLFLVVVLVVAIFVVKRKLGELAPLSEAFGEIAQGDLTPTLPESSSEIGRVSREFNTFLSGLNQLIARVRSSVYETGQMIDRLSESMQSTVSSTEQMQEIIASVKDSIVTQASITEEVASTVEGITKTIEQENDRIGEQATSVNESSAAIEQMIANVQSISSNLSNSSRQFEKLQEVTNSGSNNIESLKDTISALNTQSESVMDANAIIENIAAKTNLLAMNAAIEAAHAGEAGKGFAVVAEEIRSLAEMSNEQSGVISENLKNLEQSIEKAVSLSDYTAESFNAILHSVTTVTRLEQEISNAINEQSTGSNQILEALSEISRITEEVKDGSAEMMDKSRSVLSEISRLVSMSQEVKDSVLQVSGMAETVHENGTQSLQLLKVNVEKTREVEQGISVFIVKEGESDGLSE